MTYFTTLPKKRFLSHQAKLFSHSPYSKRTCYVTDLSIFFFKLSMLIFIQLEIPFSFLDFGVFVIYLINLQNIKCIFLGEK
jgi:hypothetical protein